MSARRAVLRSPQRTPEAHAWLAGLHSRPAAERFFGALGWMVIDQAKAVDAVLGSKAALGLQRMGAKEQLILRNEAEDGATGWVSHASLQPLGKVWHYLALRAAASGAVRP